MNPSFHLNHLQTLSQLAKVVQLGAPAAGDAVAAGATAVNLPRSASTTHYGSDGTRIASKSETSYANVRASKDGKIVGGKIEHRSTDEHGTPIDASTVDFSPEGRPSAVRTSISNRFGSGLFKTVDVDLGAVTWTAASTIHSGQIAIRTHDAASNALRMQGQVVFDDERVQSGSFVHHAWAGNAEASSYTNVDYSKAKMIGPRLAGGYCTVEVRNAEKALQSQSNIFMSSEGRVSQIHSKNFDPKTSALRSQVAATFGGIAFDPRDQFLAGDATFTVTCPQGSVLSKTTASFQNHLPSQTVTQKFDQGEPTFSILTDYAGASFNNDLKVIDSQVSAHVRNAQGQLTSTTVISYDADGNVRSKRTESFKPGENSAVATTLADYSDAVFDYQGNPVSGFATITHVGNGRTITTQKHFTPVGGLPAGTAVAVEPPAPAPAPAPHYFRTASTLSDGGGKTTARSEKITRADGTLLQTTVTKFDGEMPVSSLVTNYARDGKTVVATERLDLGRLTYDPATNRVSGQAGIETKSRGLAISAESTIQF